LPRAISSWTASAGRRIVQYSTTVEADANPKVEPAPISEEQRRYDEETVDCYEAMKHQVRGREWQVARRV